MHCFPVEYWDIYSLVESLIEEYKDKRVIYLFRETLIRSKRNSYYIKTCCLKAENVVKGGAIIKSKEF